MNFFCNLGPGLALVCDNALTAENSCPEKIIAKQHFSVNEHNRIKKSNPVYGLAQ